MSNTSKTKTKSCPFCKEEIRSEATRCKHCKSSLTMVRPSHDGICPYCKEEIQPAALKCPHCEANVGPISPTEPYQQTIPRPFPPLQDDCSVRLRECWEEADNALLNTIDRVVNAVYEGKMAASEGVSELQIAFQKWAARRVVCEYETWACRFSVMIDKIVDPLK